MTPQTGVNASSPPESMLTTSEAAARLQVSRRRIRYMIQSDLLPATQHGRDWAIPEGGVVNILKLRESKSLRAKSKEKE